MTTGANNLAVVYHGDGTPPASSDCNTTSLKQRGDLNQVLFDGLSSDNKATMSQSGKENLIQGVAGVAPFGGSYAVQYGNNNVLTVTQTSNPAGLSQTASVDQRSNFNNSVSTQGNN